MQKFIVAMLLVPLFLFTTTFSFAAKTWSGGSVVNGNWSTDANWVGGVPDNDAINFDAAIANTWGSSAGNPVVIDAASTLYGLYFTGAAGNYFIGTTGGNSLMLAEGNTIFIDSAANFTATNAIETINAPIVLSNSGGSIANNSANGTGAGAGTLNIGGGITGGNAVALALLSVSGSNTNLNTISGIIANGSATSLRVVKNGAGTWVFSGANSYTGNTYLQFGILEATTNASALGTGAVAISGGAALDLFNDTGLAFGNNITVSSNASINADTLTAVAGVTHTLGTLSIDGRILTFGLGNTAVSGTQGLTLGNITLSGSSTL
jgi:autotransporter-associated beta strand protein